LSGQERLLLAGQEPQRHHAHPVPLQGWHRHGEGRSHGQRNDRLPPDGISAPPDAEHEGHIWAVHVGIQQPDPIAEPGQAEREIDGHRRLTNPAFATRHSEQPVRAGNRLRIGYRFIRVWLWLARFASHRSPFVDSRVHRTSAGCTGRYCLIRCSWFSELVAYILQEVVSVEKSTWLLPRRCGMAWPVSPASVPLNHFCNWFLKRPLSAPPPIWIDCSGETAISGSGTLGCVRKLDSARIVAV
jgi:hypothetical protein